VEPREEEWRDMEEDQGDEDVVGGEKAGHCLFCAAVEFCCLLMSFVGGLRVSRYALRIKC
jgi:hypothetical protein